MLCDIDEKALKRSGFASPLEEAECRLARARAEMRGAQRAAELGDLLPGNGPEKIEHRLRAAAQFVAEAEAAWRALLN